MSSQLLVQIFVKVLKRLLLVHGDRLHLTHSLLLHQLLLKHHVEHILDVRVLNEAFQKVNLVDAKSLDVKLD